MYELSYKTESRLIAVDGTISRFTLCLNGVPVAFTAGARSFEEQERTARLFASSRVLYDALAQMLDADGDLDVMDFDFARRALALAGVD